MALRAEYLQAAIAVDRPELLQARLATMAEHGDVIAIDDVGVLIGDPQWEAQLIAIYQRLLAQQGRLVLSHAGSAHTLTFAIEDLGSRLRSLLHFRLQPLDDGGKADLLRTRAAHRGYELPDAVIEYWLTRGPRDIGSLLQDLDMLDRTSLRLQRPVTIPLLKQALGY